MIVQKYWRFLKLQNVISELSGKKPLMIPGILYFKPEKRNPLQ